MLLGRHLLPVEVGAALSVGLGDLSREELRRIAEFMRGHVGIELGDAKHRLVEARLIRRVNSLGLHSFREYVDFVLQTPGGHPERVQLTDALTTNKTEFYREQRHFDALVSQLLPTLRSADHTLGCVRPFRCWSAGCSTGEEPYSIAMVLSATGNTSRYEVLGTDISTRALRVAMRAVYTDTCVEQVPLEVRRSCLLRGRDPHHATVKITKEIRDRVTFRQLNLAKRGFRLEHPMDVIFCRNVMIYFSRETVRAVVLDLCRNLQPSGYLIIGHSESLQGLGLPLEAVSTNIYRRVADRAEWR